MRYTVIKGSESGHCCFEATILDTEKETPFSTKEEPEYEAVCECLDLESAEVVVRALNASI